jgi:hypothetical protein
MAVGGVGAWPAKVTSEASPPHSSRISLVASSRPGTRDCGSTVRAKRYWASELMPVERPVWAVRIGSNQALSTKTSVVVSEQPVLSPPITPPRPMAPEPSAMTQISGVTA